MAATENERRDALLRHDLPSHRVIELPELGASGPVHSDRVQGALARMLELGPIPKSTPHLARQLATLALPLLREWATWLAVDEARPKIAAHVSFIRSKSGPPPKARIMFVVPDARALGVLRGLLHRLSREHHEVSVVVTDKSTSDAALARFEGHWGLSVGRAPRSGPATTGVQVLDAISLLEDRKPNVVVVVPHRTLQVVEGEYVKAARWLGIWSVCLPLRWDDLEASRGWRHEPPDLFAVWNEEQGRKVISTLTLPANRIQVTGAVLPSDIVEGHHLPERAAYCTRMGIDPSRRIVLIDAPAVSSPAWLAHFQAWRQDLKGTANPDTHDAAVVVYVENQDAVPVWHRLASSIDITVARAGADEERIAFRLAESLAAADVVVATDLMFALEATSRMKPTIVMSGASGPGTGDLERFLEAYPSVREQLTIERTKATAVAQVVIALSRGIPPHVLRQAAAIVRPDGKRSGTEYVYQLLADLAQQDYSAPAPVRPPLWQRLVVLLHGTLVRGADRAASKEPHALPPDRSPR
jgi:hypothetical protein